MEPNHAGGHDSDLRLDFSKKVRRSIGERGYRREKDIVLIQESNSGLKSGSHEPSRGHNEMSTIPFEMIDMPTPILPWLYGAPWGTKYNNLAPLPTRPTDWS